MLFTTSAVGQTNVVEEDTVFVDGSTVTINTGDSNAIAVNNLPDDAKISDVSSGGVYDDSQPLIFYFNEAGLPDTVSFVLTPGDSYAAGDAINFTIDEGSESSEIQLDVVERDHDDSTANPREPSNDDPDIIFEEYDDLTGELVWQGQTITIEDEEITNETTISVYEWINDSSSELQTTASTDTGSVSVDTEELTEGDYFLYAPGVNFASNGSTVRGTPKTTFGIFEQTLTADFDKNTVTNEGTESDTDFEFDSNRDIYPITIHANGELNSDELAEIFGARSSFRLQYSAEDDDGKTDYDEIGIEPVQDADDYVIDFTDIDTGSYEFSFEATDSTAKDTDSITVRDANVDAEFAEAVTQDAAGDITRFNLTLTDIDYSYVQIGGEDAGFVDVLYVEADNSSKPIEVEINTRLLGTSAEIDRVYNVNNVDAFESEVHGGVTTTPPGESLYEDDGVDLRTDFEAYIDELGIANAGESQIIRPLQPTDYRVTAANSANLNGTTSVFDADAGGEANDGLGSKTIELTQPDIDDITIYTAPEADANAETNVSKLLNNATEQTEVAAGNRLIVEVEATGIYGALIDGTNEYGADFDRLDDGLNSQVLHTVTELDSEQIAFELRQRGPTGNQAPLVIDLQRSSDDDVYVVLDEDNNRFFLIANTSSDDAFGNGDAPSDDVNFTTTMEYTADNADDRFEFADQANLRPYVAAPNSRNYPYLLQGEAVRSNHEFSFTTENNESDDEKENPVNNGATFGKSVSTEQAGDIVSLNLTLEDTDNAYVQIGGEDAGFVDVLYIEADNNENPVEVEINTRLLGTNVDTFRAYNVNNVDIFESEVHGGISTTPSEGSSLYEDDGVSLGNDFRSYIDALDIIDQPDEAQIPRPLQPTDYNVVVASEKNVDHVFNAGSDGGANKKLATKIIELTQPSIGDITTYSASKDNADSETNVNKLLNNATSRTNIPAESRLIVEVEATGIYGALVDGGKEYGTNFDRLDEGVSSQVLHEIIEVDSEQVTFELRERGSTGNQEPLRIDLQRSSDDNVYVVLDEDNDRFFLIADTSLDNTFLGGNAPSDSVGLRTTLEYTADNADDRFEFADQANPQPYSVAPNSRNYPYLLQGKTLRYTQEFSFVADESNSGSPDERLEDTPVDPEVAGIVDQNNDEKITLAEIVQANLERINDPNDKVDGVTVSLSELVELNVWRVSQ